MVMRHGDTPQPPRHDGYSGIPCGAAQLGRRSKGSAPSSVDAERNSRSLQRLLSAVQEHANIDFIHYKLPTILRRVQRRTFATNMPDLGAYRQYLDSHPDEYPQLVSSFLIRVTEFFRDADLFEALQQRVLPQLLAEARKQGHVLRLWSAGCATGEEPYSLAILVAELLVLRLDELEQVAEQVYTCGEHSLSAERACASMPRGNRWQSVAIGGNRIR